MDWEATFDLQLDQYRNTRDKLEARGYSIAWMSVRGIAESRRVSTIWLEDNAKFFARTGLTADELEGQIGDHPGMSLVCVNPYRISRGVRFACVWREPQVRTVAKWNVTQDEVESTIDSTAVDGTRLVQISGYRADDGTPRYSLLFKADGGNRVRYCFGKRSDEFERLIEEWKGDDFKPLQISSYQIGDVNYNAAVCEERTKKGSGWAWNNTFGEFLKLHDEHTAKGRRLVSIDAVLTRDSERRFSAVWLPTGDPRPRSADRIPFKWPVPDTPNHDIMISNYTDDDPRTDEARDYRGQGHSDTYDGHSGIDIRSDTLTISSPDMPEIYAVARGTVTDKREIFKDDWTAWGLFDTVEPDKSKGVDWRGNYVVIEHPNGLETTYAHMTKGSIVVSKGQAVAKGDLLGKIGSSGNSSRPHLHLLTKDEYGNWFSPIIRGLFANYPK